MKSKRILASILSVLLVSQTMMFVPINAEDTTDDVDASVSTDDADDNPSIFAYWKDGDASTHTIVITVTGDVGYATLYNLWDEGGVSSDLVYEVIIGEGIQEISKNLFSEYTNLKKVTLPKSLVAIQQGAFYGCSHLTDINLEECENLVSIGAGAFSGTALTEVTLPDGLMYLGAKDIYAPITDEDEDETDEDGTKDLVKIVSDNDDDDGSIMGMVQSLINRLSSYGTTMQEIASNIVFESEGGVFSDCTKLKTVNLPDSLTYLPPNTFKGCTSLTTVGSIEGTVTFSENLVYIGAGAFNGCTSITNLDMPDTVLKVGCDGNYDDKNGAFKNCTSLKTAKLSDGLNEVPYAVFEGCESLESVNIPENATVIQYAAFRDCSVLSNIVMPNTITLVGAHAFANCTSLKDITLSDSIKDISYNAFQNCTSITHMSLPNTVTTIGDNAFDGCENLKSIELSENLTSIGMYGFQDCTSLFSVDLPDSLNTLGACAFANCTSLIEMVVPENCLRLGYNPKEGQAFYDNTIGGVFKGCTSLEKVVLPTALSTIRDDMFNGCTLLSDVNIPSDVTSIGSGVFMGCESLTEVTLPDNLYDLGSSAFEDSGITSIKLPETLETIGEGAFSGCVNLESVEFPETVLYDTIPTALFNKCSSLKELTIPNGITDLGQYIVSDCTSLETLYIPDGVTSIPDYCLTNLPSLTVLYVPESAEEVINGYFMIDLNVNHLSIFCYDTSITESGRENAGSNVKFISPDKTDLISAILVRKQILGVTTTYNPDADINQDGKVNVLDMIAIKSKLLNE